MRVRRTYRIDAQLGIYASTTRAITARTCSVSAGKRWVAHGAAAGAALTMAPAAEALPIYSGLQNVRVMTDAVGLDLDGDGMVDFTAMFGGPGRDGGLGIPAGNRVMTFDRGLCSLYAMAVQPGAAISAGGYPWGRRCNGAVGVGPYSTPYDGPGGFQPSMVGFAGVRFQGSGGERFAWIRLHLEGSSPSDTTALLVRDWAYESEPGVGILAGEGLTPVPEPAGLALLATGAAGIAAWRRRRAVAR